MPCSEYQSPPIFFFTDDVLGIPEIYRYWWPGETVPNVNQDMATVVRYVPQA